MVTLNTISEYFSVRAGFNFNGPPYRGLPSPLCTLPF